MRPLAMLGIGMIVGLVYHKTGSIWFACLAHGANNMIAGRIGKYFDFTESQSVEILVWVTAIWAVVGAAAILLVKRKAA